MSEPHRGRRRALWAAGIAAGAAVGAVAARTLVRRVRGNVDPEVLAELAELPPEDLGPVRTHDGLDLAVRAAGTPGAPVLVFIHGFSLDLTMWNHQWRGLADRYRCVLYDHRGHGRSARSPDGDYSLQAMGRDLRAVLDATVGDGPCVLVTHSMGGMCLLAFAEAHPEEFGTRVAGVVLADTAAAELLRGAVGVLGARLEALFRPRLRAALSVRDRAEQLRRLFEARAGDLAFAVARLTNFGPGADPAIVEHITALSVRVPVEVWTDALAGLIEMDLRHALEHVRVPALVVVGDLDRITPPASALAMKRALPSARLVVFRGAGHLPMLEQPERFNGLVASLADRVFERAAAPAGRRRRRAAASGS
jgi:pimeloyl-ACP methyl ester carboxylesterase